MSEANLQNNVRTRLKLFGILVKRISNRADVGTPDQCYCYDGGEGWIELKFKSRWPPRGGPLKVGLEREQWIWLDEWAAAGGCCWVLAQVGRRLYLWEGCHAEELYHGVTEERAMEISFWAGGEGAVWRDLATALM
tara:strand:+ start:3267 stop:3674 length:408 start_codon:yes stop_codon:yes gene_type:complete